jgi:fibronectin-binding autotransporter adhesin
MKAILVFVVVAFSVSNLAVAQTTNIWVGGGDGIWSNPDNDADWDTPYADGNVVEFTAGAGGAVAVDGDGVSPASILVDSTGDYTFSGGAIGGAGALTKAGAGILTLTGVNTFTGDITINSGELHASYTAATGALGDGTYNGNIYIAAGATLLIGRDPQELGGVISGGGNVEYIDGSRLTLSGENTYSGKTVFTAINKSTVSLTVSSFNSINGGNPPLTSSSLGRPTTTENGIISIGAGTRALNASLDYVGAGETTDRQLSFSFNNGGSKQSIIANGSGPIRFTTGFDINWGPSSVGGITLTGAGDGEVAGGLTGDAFGGYLDKDGEGIWTLGGTNNVDSVTIKNGDLLVTGSLTGRNTITVNAAGTLGGTGTISGTNTVSGTVSPGTNTVSGSASGTLTFEHDLIFTDGSTYALDGGDLVSVTGELALNDNWTLTLGDNLKNGGSITVFSYGSLAGGADLAPAFDISNLGFTPGTLSLADTGSEIVLNGVQHLDTPPAGTLIILR